MMTNWKQIKKLAGPNPEVFPGGEKVYLFCSLARLQPPWCSEDIRPWLRQFAAEAGANGLETEVREGHVYVIVPQRAAEAFVTDSPDSEDGWAVEESRIPMTIEDIELSHGFSAGNYANAYESTDMTTALAGHDHGDHNPDSPAYHSGFVLGFFSSYESHEIPCDAADTHEAALSTHGPLARKLGLIDTEGTGNKS